RVLQEREFERVGGSTAVKVDVRLILATNRDLERMVKAGEFRADLYYRIGVAFIELPPLRERREDIPLLFEHFTLLAASRYERTAPIPSSAQMAELMAYAWPGNVRELHNVADRFVLGLLGDHMTLDRGAGERAGALPHGLPQQVEHYERSLIVEELRRKKGDQAATATALGVARQTLHDKLRRLGITADEFKV
ncbi:MAG: sigma 54-interacting transcriptional regulator, partial [Rhodoferax sp.]|nr:sigma 54-interacting transcriptional regulator [Rhodoferax sp.]